MRLTFAISFLISLAALSSWPSPSRAESEFFRPGELQTPFDQERAMGSTWRLESSTGYGTVFFVSPDGEFLTNIHVVDELGALEENRSFDASDWKLVNDYLGQEVPLDRIEVLRLPQEFRANGTHVDDTDVVRCRIRFKPPAYLKIASEESTIFQEIYSVGYPGRTSVGMSKAEGTDGTLRITQGRNMGIHEKMQSDLPTLPGSSGSPVLNARGEVIGITSRAEEGMLSMFGGIRTSHVSHATLIRETGILDHQRAQKTRWRMKKLAEKLRFDRYRRDGASAHWLKSTPIAR
jgi:V8-like Glu-specific endopeptidase